MDLATIPSYETSDKKSEDSEVTEVAPENEREELMKLLGK